MTTTEFKETEVQLQLRRHPHPGLYIVFEGTGGTGKDEVSHAIEQRVRDLFPEVAAVLWTHESGGTPKAEELRRVLKTTELPLEDQIELFARAREDSLVAAVQPVLEQRGIVLSGRSAISSIAYQAFGGGAGVETVVTRNYLFMERFIPDIVVCAERDLSVALAQARAEYGRGDVFDQDLAFNLRVQQGYRWARQEFGSVCDWVWIDNLDGLLNLEQTIDRVWEGLLPKVYQWWVKTYRASPDSPVFLDL